MKRMNKILFTGRNVLLLCLLIGLTNWKKPEPPFKNGVWKSVLVRPDGKEIVFNFLTKDSAGKKLLFVLNAEERLLVDSIVQKGDSVFIQMPFFESGFKARITKGGNLEGVWIKKTGEKEQSLSFKAVHNQRQRFAAPVKPRFNASGKWAVDFTGNNRVTKAIGEFRQKGSRLTGTFLTASGDYRYLEGVVSGDSLFLSGFDGGHAFLFTAKLTNDSTISAGNFYSGASGTISWAGKKDDKVQLPDGYQQTHLREGESKLNFSFPSLAGDLVSINDLRYKNKVIVIQILGSWCPNCMDETEFLSNYYNRNKQKGVEVIGLAYERSTDFDKSKTALQRFEKRFNVQYPILITGVTVSDKQRTEKTLPQLTELKAFPTSIFIDKKGNVRKIYSGFSGPGTGQHYVNFQKEFDETINGLLAE
jgi:thiol-disulfide isomerase/thioredoxin